MPELELTTSRPETTGTLDSDAQNVVDRVFHQLGRPHNLYHVKARKLWGDHYRVNIYCTVDTDRPITTVAMTDTFFVTVDEDGAISSNPPIRPRYR